MKIISKVLIGYKYNQIPADIQVFTKKNLDPIPPAHMDPEDFFGSYLTYVERKVLNYLIWMHRNVRWNYVSQDHIANHVGIGRQYVNTVIKKLKHLGLIDSLYRHMNTCLYRVSSFFFSDEMTSRLRHILPALKCLLVSLLLSVSRETTQYIYKGNRIYTNRLYERSGKESMKQFQQVMHGDSPISEQLRAVTSVLNLSRAGQIRLCAFPDEAIIAAAGEFKYTKNVRDPFGWFFKLCFNYCNRNEIKPDWEFCHKLRDKYGIKENASPIANLNPVQKHDSVVKKESSSSLYKPWNGHTTPERTQPRREYSREEKRSQALKALCHPSDLFDGMYRLAPRDAQVETYNLIFTKEACYCHDIEKRWGWKILISDTTCLHGTRKSNEEISHSRETSSMGSAPSWTTPMGYSEKSQNGNGASNGRAAW